MFVLYAKPLRLLPQEPWWKEKLPWVVLLLILNLVVKMKVKIIWEASQIIKREVAGHYLLYP